MQLIVIVLRNSDKTVKYDIDYNGKTKVELKQDIKMIM